MAQRLFFIVFMSFFSYVYSNSNHAIEVPCASSIMTIEAVDVSDKTTIFLNNRTVWTCKYKDLFDGPYGWHLGDRVHIVYVFCEGYYLQNASCQGCVPVRLQNANATDLKVVTIKEIIKDDKKSTNTIVMNDATKWFVGSWSSGWMGNWQAGDRILVTAQEFVFGNADHLLLNLDRGRNNLPKNVRAQLLYSPKAIKFEDLNKRETRDWKVSIDCIWPETDSFMIELNSKIIFKCYRSKLNWKIGDSVRFDLDDKEWKLINLRSSEEISTTFVNSYSKEINLPIIQKISRNGKRIVLSDDSVWFSRTDIFGKWQKGDRMIVSSLPDVNFNTSTHILINIDRPTREKNIPSRSSATLVK